MTTQQRISLFKWGIVLIIAILIFMFWRGCKNEGKGIKTPDTISVKTDTIWLPSKADTFYTPAETKTEYVPEYKTDTLEWTEYLPVDTANILKDYLATRYYRDSISVQYGRVYISDTVSKNKIVSRGIKTSFNIPVVKETVTLQRQRKTVVYLGFEGIGNHESIVYGVGATFGLKLKNNKYYGIKVLMNKDGNPLYGVEFKIPIRFNKQ